MSNQRETFPNTASNAVSSAAPSSGQARAGHAGRPTRRPRPRPLRLIVGVGVALVMVGVVIALARSFAQSPTGTIQLAPGQPANGQAVDGLACVPLRQSVEQGQAALTLYVDGQPQPLPVGIGLVLPVGPTPVAQGTRGLDQCAYQLHMHGNDGILRMDTSAGQAYTLSQFFDLWGQPLSQAQVAGYRADASHALRFVVFDARGLAQPYTGDPRAIRLTPNTTVAILYNSPDVQPQPRAWSQP